MARSINKLSDESNQTASKFAFTVINGDLTAYFHPDQHSEFRAIYHAGFPWAYPVALKTPVYLGLGNHDYENNLNNGNSFSTDNNRCAKKRHQLDSRLGVSWLRQKHAQRDAGKLRRG
jgi:hypothetical protein